MIKMVKKQTLLKVIFFKGDKYHIVGGGENEVNQSP